MNANFARSLAAVLRHEGGFSDHPADNGGATNKGVTLATYRKLVNPAGTVQDLKRITNDEVAKVYRVGYWDVIQGDALPSGVDYATFDYATNSGPGRAVKALQGVLGVPVDGIVGPVTLAAAKAADPIVTIDKLCAERMAFLKRLDDWPVFKNGWTTRVGDVRDDAIQMTAAPIPRPSSPTIHPHEPEPEDAIAPPPEKKSGNIGWIATLILVALAIVSAAALYLWS